MKKRSQSQTFEYEAGAPARRTDAAAIIDRAVPGVGSSAIRAASPRRSHQARSSGQRHGLPRRDLPSRRSPTRDGRHGGDRIAGPWRRARPTANSTTWRLRSSSGIIGSRAAAHGFRRAGHPPRASPGTPRGLSCRCPSLRRRATRIPSAEAGFASSSSHVNCRFKLGDRERWLRAEVRVPGRILRRTGKRNPGLDPPDLAALRTLLAHRSRRR